MKIEIEIDDLSELITAFNDAYLMLHKQQSKNFCGVYDDMDISLYQSLHKKLGEPSEKWDEYLTNELSILRKVYKQLEKLEDEQNKGN